MASPPKSPLSPAARQRLASALAAGGPTAPSPDQMMPAPHAVAPAGFGGSLRVDPTEKQPLSMLAAPTPGFSAVTPPATPGFRGSALTVTPGMRITGSRDRLAAILAQDTFSRLSQEQAEAAVNRATHGMGIGNFPSGSTRKSAERLQAAANTLYPDLVPSTGEPDDLTVREKRLAAYAAQQAQTAATNAMLAKLGLPENPWDLPHREQSAALETMLGQRGIPYTRTTGAEGSHYYSIQTAPGDDAPSITVRFADHANTSRLHDLPDYNITTSTAGNPDAGDHSLDQVVRALKGWSLF